MLLQVAELLGGRPQQLTQLSKAQAAVPVSVKLSEEGAGVLPGLHAVEKGSGNFGIVDQLPSSISLSVMIHELNNGGGRRIKGTENESCLWLVHCGSITQGKDGAL